MAWAPPKRSSSIATTAQGILDSADCAIGHEAARMVLKSLRSFEEDYRSHAERDLCSAERNAYVPARARVLHISTFRVTSRW